MLQDHAGRERQHLAGGDAKLSGQRVARGARSLQARLAGTGVGIAGVDHQRADARARGQVLAADLHRRGAEAVLREHAGHGAALGHADHEHILAIGLADARLGPTQLHAGNGFQILCLGQRQVHGHVRLLGCI
ncbi:hypothetical protein D3C72_1891400 [compost metagenome]